MKRLIDIVASIVGLIVLGPLLLVVSSCIVISSAGPVMFRQVRIGRGGTPFRIHKFRTMVHTQPSKGTEVTVANDPRITRIGALLRRTKIDELPQLLDVLVGNMSLVGPRPEVPRFVEEYPLDVRDVVLSVRPGITDPASIAFRNESDLLASVPDPEAYYSRVILPRKLAMYVEYVRGQSAFGDARILLRTIGALVGRRSEIGRVGD